MRLLLLPFTFYRPCRSVGRRLSWVCEQQVSMSAMSACWRWDVLLFSSLSHTSLFIILISSYPFLGFDNERWINVLLVSVAISRLRMELRRLRAVNAVAEKLALSRRKTIISQENVQKAARNGDEKNWIHWWWWLCAPEYEIVRQANGSKWKIFWQFRNPIYITVCIPSADSTRTRNTRNERSEMRRMRDAGVTSVAFPRLENPMELQSSRVCKHIRWLFRSCRSSVRCGGGNGCFVNAQCGCSCRQDGVVKRL